MNIRFGNALCFQFFCDCRKGENIVILVFDFVGSKFLVSLADEIILAIKAKHIRRKQRLGVISNNTCRKTEICRFHIPVAVIDTDNF